jgi:hypothetical protein
MGGNHRDAAERTVGVEQEFCHGRKQGTYAAVFSGTATPYPDIFVGFRTL